MPELHNPGQAFLTAFTRYIDFRLTEKGPPQPAPKHLEAFVDLFAALLAAHVGAESHREAVADLVAKMSKMKETRGTGDPTPESPTPSG